MRKAIATIALFLGAFLSFIGLSGCGVVKSASTDDEALIKALSNEKTACVPDKDDPQSCPPPIWQQGFERATKLETALNDSIPKDRHYDRMTGHFVKNLPPPAQPPVVVQPQKVK